MATTPNDRTPTSAPAYELAGCELAFECPMEWHDLAYTDWENVRNCDTCKKQVTFCSSKESFDELASRGDCVAFWQRTPTEIVRRLGHPARSDKLRKYLDEL